MNEARQGNKTLIVFLVLLITPMSGATIDLYVPSLPYITHHFNSTNTLVQLTITTYLLGYGLFQSFYGTLSDSFGRRGVLIFELFLYVCSSLMAPLSPNIYILLLLRFIQGLAMAGPGVITKSIISDRFKGMKLAKTSNYMAISWAIGPIIAPFIGGYLQAYVGWQAPFYFMAAYGLMAVILVMFFMPETNFNRHPLQFKTMANNYNMILSHKIFIGAVLLLALSYSLITVFNVIGPFLVQKVLGYSPIVYGHMALWLGVAWFLGNTANRFLMVRWHVHHIIIINLLICLVVSFVMFIIGLIEHISLWVIVAPTLLLFVCGGVIFPNCLGRALSLFPKMGGAASATLGSLCVIGAGAMSGIASLLKTKSQVPLSVIYIVLALISIGVYVFLLRTTFKKELADQKNNKPNS